MTRATWPASTTAGSASAGSTSAGSTSAGSASLARDGGHDDDGVDVTLIRWMLSLTPAERLAVLQGFVDSVHRMRRGDRP